MVGLAPSAAAADVLAGDLGIDTENTAKWLYEHAHTCQYLTAGQLVIVDEASLAGTFALDVLITHAASVGAKVLLVGDPHQLDAVDAGGAFGMLVSDRRANERPAPELTDVRRFHNEWEKRASLRLRAGDADVLDAYDAHGRIRGGDTETVLDAAYAAWKADTAAGKSSLMVAEKSETVTRLNTRARGDRIATGHVAPGRAVALHDGTHVSVGDRVVTRKNNRRLHAGRRWVKNGDHWKVTRVRADGTLRIRRVTPNGRLGSSVLLPADYAAAHVELGYAVTVHRAQGATVETTHLLVASARMVREAFLRRDDPRPPREHRLRRHRPPRPRNPPA